MSGISIAEIPENSETVPGQVTNVPGFTILPPRPPGFINFPGQSFQIDIYGGFCK